MRAKKLPSGSYRVQVMVKGERKSFTAPTKKEAELMAAEWQNGKRLSEDTVGACIDEYIASKSHILSPSTLESYKKVKRIQLASLCNIRICDLSPVDVQKHFNELSLKYSAKTVTNAHGLLASVLNVYAPDIHLHTTLPKQQKHIKSLPPVPVIIEAVTGSPIELPCLLALWLGLRMSEIRGARRSDIKDGVLTISHTVITVGSEHIEKDTTKTYDSTRRIALPQRIQCLIDALPDGQDNLTTLSGQAIYKRFSRLLERKGIEHITFHDLRHMNASIMLALGVPDKYAMERGGWSSPHIMKSVYQHTFSDMRTNVDELINSFFEAQFAHEIAHDADDVT